MLNRFSGERRLADALPQPTACLTASRCADRGLNIALANPFSRN
jgi:hypothetical protein